MHPFLVSLILVGAILLLPFICAVFTFAIRAEIIRATLGMEEGNPHKRTVSRVAASAFDGVSLGFFTLIEASFVAEVLMIFESSLGVMSRPEENVNLTGLNHCLLPPIVVLAGFVISAVISKKLHSGNGREHNAGENLTINFMFRLVHLQTTLFSLVFFITSLALHHINSVLVAGYHPCLFSRISTDALFALFVVSAIFFPFLGNVLNGSKTRLKNGRFYPDLENAPDKSIGFGFETIAHILYALILYPFVSVSGLVKSLSSETVETKK